jgi:AcrR family transcriptional regulator
MPSRTKSPAPARTRLSRDRVLAAALDLVQEAGVDALSMRKLGETLGVEAMSLYNHVRNKDDILDGLVEMVMKDMACPPLSGDWRASMRQRAFSVHEVLVRCPWAASMIEARPNPGPVRLGLCDAVLGVLRNAGFSLELAYHASITLDAYIYGFTFQQSNWPSDAAGREAAVDAARPRIDERAYPHIVETMGYVVKRAPAARRAHTASSTGYAGEFEFGLNLILDALERARLGQKATERTMRARRVGA